MNLPDTRNRDFVTDRAALAAGYRAYADLIEQHPEVPVTYPVELTLWVHRTHGEPEDDRREKVANLLRILPGAWTRRVESYSPTNMDFIGWVEGLPVRIVVGREGVCERVVTGTEKITEVIPAVTEDDLRPEQTVTRVIEHVEWVCAPILADATESAEVSA